MRNLKWLLAIVAIVPISVILAALYVASNDGFGKGDIDGFAFYSALFAGGLLLVFLAVRPLIQGRQSPGRAIGGLIAGTIAGFLGTFAVAIGMGGWMGAFSFPVLYIWTAAAAVCFTVAALTLQPAPATIGPARVARRIAGAVGAIALLGTTPILFLLGNVFIWGRAQHEVYVLPAGYEGPVFVIFDRQGVAAIGEVDGAREIVIPPTGVLLTSSPPNEGFRNPDVYYLRSDGGREPVRTDWSHHDTTSTVRAYWLGTRIGAVLNGVRQPEMRYDAFLVAPMARDAELYHRSREVLDSLWALYAR
jgi:hypothetical protein